MKRTRCGLMGALGILTMRCLAGDRFSDPQASDLHPRPPPTRIVGQNLLDDRQPEFAPTVIPSQRTEVERGVYGKLTLHF